MQIDHIAIWVINLEAMKGFYMKFFNAKSSKKYENLKKGFSSYFLSFDSGARIEIMHRMDITDKGEEKGTQIGLAHLAISAGSKKVVDELTEMIRNNGFEIFGEPRMTGDGYYESVISDPEGNRIEITE